LDGEAAQGRIGSDGLLQAGEGGGATDGSEAVAAGAFEPILNLADEKTKPVCRKDAMAFGDL
jgi:hypothetical protein